MEFFKLNKIDELIINQKIHFYLTKDDIDSIAYLGEFIASGGYSASITNNLIDNFKIEPSETQRLKYKQQAIEFFAQNLIKVLPKKWLKSTTFVPTPPSKSKSDLNYDDRLNHLLTKMSEYLGFSLDIRELFIQKRSTEATHKSAEKRLTPAQRKQLYVIDHHLLEPSPTNIVIIDDMITTGSHFKALQALLLESFPHIKTYGLFLARRIEKEDKFRHIAQPAD